MPRAQNRADESRHRRRSRCCWPHRLGASHRPRRSRARHRGRARAARRASIWAPLMTVIPYLMSAPRGTSTATAPKPRLLDSCAAAVYAAAATPSRDPRRPVCRALLPSLPALLDRILTIYAAASAATRTATLVAPAPRLSSARALSPSPSRAVVASQGSITSPPLLSLSATPSSALAACRASRRGTGRSAARFAAKAKTKNYPAGGSEPPCRATAASSPKRTLLSDDNSNTPFGLSSNQKTDGAADARTVLYQRVTSTSQPSLLVTP